VEVTLRRVAEALASSDLNTLLNPDSELERSLKELVPSNMSTNPNGDLNDTQFRQEFSDFVEVIKAKENVRKIMGELQRLAPAIYEALVGERDAYMAAGLNGLNEIETIVAVVGIAHVDGIERNLKMNGWQPGNLSCPTS
jgi:pheromone shutdown protein TraB